MNMTVIVINLNNGAGLQATCKLQSGPPNRKSLYGIARLFHWHRALIQELEQAATGCFKLPASLYNII